MKKTDYPKTLELYRGDMLCLTVDVEKASKMELVENNTQGPTYRKHRPFDLERGSACGRSGQGAI